MSAKKSSEKKGTALSRGRRGHRRIGEKMVQETREKGFVLDDSELARPVYPEQKKTDDIKKAMGNSAFTLGDYGKKIEGIVAAAGARTMSEDQAITELVKLGFDKEDAREQILIAMGGDDV